MIIRQAQREAWELAEAKGFHDSRSADGRDDILVRLCLVHTEVSEAAQEVKRHWTDSPSVAQREVLGEELADAVIRIFDLCEGVGIDLQDSIARKMARNRQRPHLFGTPFAAKP